MNWKHRTRALEAMIEVIPVPIGDCEECDPSGGCAQPHECKRDLAIKLIEAIERETGL